MSSPSRIRKYQNLTTLARKLRGDIKDHDCMLLYAYNRTGKTRLSMEFKNQGKKKGNGVPDTLYYNAFTEDLFVWYNDLECDTDRYLKINKDSSFLIALTELALDKTISDYLSRYADFDFDIDYEAWKVSFHKDSHEHIKISRGEENIFIWSVFMAISERVIDGHPSYSWVKYLFVDDPVSSLDDNNAIAIACDLATLIRDAAVRRNTNRERNPIKTICSTHHSLFFNVVCNEIGRSRLNENSITFKRYYLHRPDSAGAYTLRATEDTPYFHHVAVLAELCEQLKKGTLYTFHFNALRSVLEKTASFFGHKDLRMCLHGMEDEILYNRALNLLSHGRYSITEPVEMVDDNKELFRRILVEFLNRFGFALPKLVPEVLGRKESP